MIAADNIRLVAAIRRTFLNAFFQHANGATAIELLISHDIEAAYNLIDSHSYIFNVMRTTIEAACYAVDNKLEPEQAYFALIDHLQSQHDSSHNAVDKNSKTKRQRSAPVP